MSAIIPEKFRISRSFLFEVIVFINPFRITRSFLFEVIVFINPFRIIRSFLFEVIVFINPFRLRRSQILVARIPPPRSQRTVGAQHILDLNLRKIISHLRSGMHPSSTNVSHLRSEMLSNLIVLPIYLTYGATCSQTSSFYQYIAPTERNAPEFYQIYRTYGAKCSQTSSFYQYIAPTERNAPEPIRSTNISHLRRAWKKFYFLLLNFEF